MDKENNYKFEPELFKFLKQNFELPKSPMQAPQELSFSSNNTIKMLNTIMSHMDDCEMSETITILKDITNLASVIENISKDCNKICKKHNWSVEDDRTDTH